MMRVSAGGIGRRASGLVLLLGVVFVWPGGAQPARPLRSMPRTAQIDARAAGAFDGGGRALRSEHQARYRVDATVLIPLLSIPVAHRENVGFACAAAQEFLAPREETVRTYELFSASFPERARGLNRMGFIREVVSVGETGVLWTAHFGALSSNSEGSRQEVELDGDESLQSYTVMDGFTDRLQSWNTETHLDLQGVWSSANLFYQAIMPVWTLTRPQTEAQSQPQTEVASMQPLGFLGILQRSLSVAAVDVQRRSTPRRIRFPFAYHGELMFLDLAGHSIDRKRQRQFAAEGLIRSAATVHRLDYRILDRKNGLVQRFRIWTELLRGSASRASLAVFPLGFQFKAKSFLDLQAVRVAVPALQAPGVGDESRAGPAARAADPSSARRDCEPRHPC